MREPIPFKYKYPLYKYKRNDILLKTRSISLLRPFLTSFQKFIEETTVKNNKTL